MCVFVDVYHTVFLPPHSLPDKCAFLLSSHCFSRLVSCFNHRLHVDDTALTTRKRARSAIGVAGAGAGAGAGASARAGAGAGAEARTGTGARTTGAGAGAGAGPAGPHTNAATTTTTTTTTAVTGTTPPFSVTPALQARAALVGTLLTKAITSTSAALSWFWSLPNSSRVSMSVSWPYVLHTPCARLQLSAPFTRFPSASTASVCMPLGKSTPGTVNARTGRR